MIVEDRRARAHLDIPLIVMVFSLALFSILAVSVATFSTSSEAGQSLLNYITDSTYAMRQCLFVAVAPLIIAALLSVPFDFYYRHCGIAYLAATFLVGFTLITNRAQGVKAWTDIIYGYTIQPSEFIKLALILYLARLLSRYEHPLSNLRELIEMGVMVGIPAVIVLASGEMGSLMVVVFIVAVMLFFADTKASTLWLLFLGAVLAIAALLGYMMTFAPDSYRLARIMAFFDPSSYSSTDAYQQTQSQTAIGSGGLYGIGIFVNGAWSQLNYVPADWTDFIFATIGEAFGFVGCLAIVLMYLAIILRMLYLARYTRDRFSKLVIIGVMAMLLFHVFENVAMTTGGMPITGIPLPFISYGGSNMVTNMGGVGLVLAAVRSRSLSAPVLTPQRETAMNFYERRKKKKKKLKTGA